MCDADLRGEDAPAPAPLTTDVPVPGGTLRVGEWHPDAEGTPWLLVHGVTASHLAWSWVARETSARLIAPDLRGRGRSTALVPGTDAGPAAVVREPGHPTGPAAEPADPSAHAPSPAPAEPSQPSAPTGLARHADDLVAVLDAKGIDRAVVVGHSMGAFIALVLADRHPDRVERVLLVDGGLPLDLPPGMDPRAAVRHVLGPTAARLDMRFDTPTAYRDFWRAHPAFAGREDPLLDAYFAYDLRGTPPELRPATTFATVEADSIDQNTGTTIARARERMPRPTALLSAERGLRGEVPGLYPDLDAIVRAHPALTTTRRVPHVDHYSIVMSVPGARAVVEAVGGA
ncbi:alpha/beta fold hydrolase [Microbacterium sp. NPDC090007]|uniref:alpha/beta fold hydrolase n=1 Tax=Microbacterium sp. NPDC090007 TaxID=3364204 RepID=UPI0037F76139